MAVAVGSAARAGRLAQAGLDHVALQREADELLRRAVGYDWSVWATVDPVTLLVTSCTPIDKPTLDTDHEMRIFEIERHAGDALTVHGLLDRHPHAATMRRHVAAPLDTRRYRELLEPFAVVDELRVALVADGRCWGVVCATRSGDDAIAFSEADIEQFTSVAHPIAEGLRLAFLRAATIEPGSLDDPPAVVTIDRSHRITTASTGAASWLADLAGETDIPAIFGSLAARVATDESPSSVVVGPRGAVALHASLVDGSDDIAIVIERPRPLHLAIRVLRAYNLTPRESQVTELVLRGNTTTQIARALQVSNYTVQDHLKAIFAKVGVQTRGELANEIFVRHYLPKKQAGTTPSPYGYFLGEEVS